MNILPNAYYNYLKATKKEYHQEKKKTCDTVREIFRELGCDVGHRFMKAFLERHNINLSKTTAHKYMNQEMRFFTCLVVENQTTRRAVFVNRKIGQRPKFKLAHTSGESGRCG